MKRTNKTNHFEQCRRSIHHKLWSWNSLTCTRIQGRILWCTHKLCTLDPPDKDSLSQSLFYEFQLHTYPCNSQLDMCFCHREAIQLKNFYWFIQCYTMKFTYKFYSHGMSTFYHYYTRTLYLLTFFSPSSDTGLRSFCWGWSCNFRLSWIRCVWNVFRSDINVV